MWDFDAIIAPRIRDEKGDSGEGARDHLTDQNTPPNNAAKSTVPPPLRHRYEVPMYSAQLGWTRRS